MLVGNIGTRLMSLSQSGATPPTATEAPPARVSQIPAPDTAPSRAEPLPVVAMPFVAPLGAAKPSSIDGRQGAPHGEAQPTTSSTSIQNNPDTGSRQVNTKPPVPQPHWLETTEKALSDLGEARRAAKAVAERTRIQSMLDRMAVPTRKDTPSLKREPDRQVGEADAEFTA